MKIENYIPLKNYILLLFAVLFLLFLDACSKSEDTKPIGEYPENLPTYNGSEIPNVNKSFGGGAEHYTYAPSPIEYNGKRYIFVCENKTPNKVRDHIYLYEGTPSGDSYIWNNGVDVLGFSTVGWDKIHVCDPDVRKFDITYKEEKYHWVMFYLGTNQTDNFHNQIGLAFAKDIEGPYIKYDKNPVIQYNDTNSWGVGQSTAVIMDSTTILLFYSKGTSVHTGIFVRKLKLNSTGSFDIGNENEIPFLGLIQSNGTAATILHNASFAYSKRGVYIAAPVDPFPQISGVAPVSSKIQVAYKQGYEVQNENKKWNMIGYITQSESGFPRNHNPGILTNEYGQIENDSSLTVYFTGSVTTSDWLWSYDIYSAKFKLK